jgi:hypothetical protein
MIVRKEAPVNSRFRNTAAVLLAGSLLAGAALAAAPEEPPQCNDKESLRDVKRQYQGLEEQKQNLKIKAMTDVKELHFGAPPAGVNQYANKTNYATKSRWCQGTAALSNGKTDVVYWRMDYMVEARGHSINFDHCAATHDLLDKNCRKIREGK